MKKRLNLKRRYKRPVTIGGPRGAVPPGSPRRSRSKAASLGTASPSKDRITVLLVDDHPIVRQGLSELINQQSNLLVCGEAESAVEALDLVHKLKPGFVLVDVSLKQTSGLDLVKAVRAREPRLPLLVLSMHDEGLYAERTLRAGARGYIMKQEASEKIVEAIHCILEGNIYLSEPMKEKMLQHLIQGSTESEGFSIEKLSDRELEVFQLMGNGFGTRYIAEKLHLSIKTIESYRESLKHKLHLKKGAELVQRAIQWAKSENALV